MQETKPGLDILNTGSGHTEISFDTGNLEEVIRAKKMITDMMRQGYILFVHDDEGGVVKVKEFDETRGRYIISGDAKIAASEPVPPFRKKKGSKKASVSMEKVRATAMGRSAGG